MYGDVCSGPRMLVMVVKRVEVYLGVAILIVGCRVGL
jgi:hypothetical protein